MSGCARSCLVNLALWAAFAGANYWYTRQVQVSIAAGLLMATAVLLLYGVATTARERRRLLEATLGVHPEDGTWIAVSGAIRSRAPLRAPISGESVVTYEYKIERAQRIRGRLHVATWYSGKALAPSTISTRYGTIRLLAVPMLDLELEQVEQAKAIENAAAHLRAATFEPRQTSDQRTGALEREWTDDDGSFRIDQEYVTDAPDLADGFRFEERHVKQGETVCAFGLYSRTRGGLVPDKRWGRHPRLMRGAADGVAAALGRRMVRYGVVAVLLGVAGAVWVASTV